MDTSQSTQTAVQRISVALLLEVNPYNDRESSDISVFCENAFKNSDNVVVVRALRDQVHYVVQNVEQVIQVCKELWSMFDTGSIVVFPRQSWADLSTRVAVASIEDLDAELI